MTFHGWDKVEITTDSGEIKTASAPVIISASRSTDIPAFHSDWFMNRLRRGYVKWNNPFNALQPQYVSFEKARVFVFWTKNPKPMLRYLDELEEKGINFYFTYTLNDYEQERFEPKVPSLAERIDVFQALAEKIGSSRVIWRFDPLILTDRLDADALLERIDNVGERVRSYTEKLVVSFVDVDVYPKVQNNLRRFGVQARPFDETSILKIAAGLQQLHEKWGLDIATCGESMDLGTYGILHNRCIDDELMIRCFREDDALMEFLGVPKYENLDLFNGGQVLKRPYLKDGGQRKACGCVVSKDIGQYNTCGHLCVYCYANFSEMTVERNFHCLDKQGESILRAR